MGDAREDAAILDAVRAGPKAGDEKHAQPEHITFAATDGFPLTGTWFAGDGDGPAILVSAATAVPRGYYTRFAQALVQSGAAGVLSYDYRGLPGSPSPKGWRAPLLMRHWALHDFPAALDELEQRAGTTHLAGIGQSFGGQALGLSGTAHRFARYANVAALSGYWRNTATPLRVLLSMNAVGVPMTWAFGRTFRAMGIGEPLPGPVFREWARWCRTPDYFMSDPSLPETARFADVTTPVLSVRHDDDPWGTEKAVEALLGFYPNAPVTRLVLGPAQAGEPVGHLGFFRSRFAETLWPPVVNWLMTGAHP